MQKVAVITGASAGIGAALAKELAKRGWGVALGARRPEMLSDVARACGPDALAVQMDATRRMDHEKLRDGAIARFGHVDAWVNNVGRGIHRSLLEITDAEFDEVIDTNLRSCLYGMQAIVPYFVGRNAGHVVNVSSMLGRVPFTPHRAIYNAAKAGVNMLTTNLRMELRERAPGVHVTLVMPGIVATDFPTAVVGEREPHWTPGAQVGRARVQAVDDVARIMADAMEKPVPELYTNPAGPDIVRSHYADPSAL